MKRRTLIRLLVGLGFGIPIAVEAATFLGLVNARLFGGGDGDETTATDTPARDRVAVGETFLPETAATERLSTGTITAKGDRWLLTLTVIVENDGDAPYELRIGPVTTGSGKTIEGTASTGVLHPGEQGTATGQWPLPPGSTPRWLRALATVGKGSDRRTSEKRVPLADIAVTYA